jgi:omega-amidase
MFSAKIDSIKEETDLIILPEMFTTGFTMNAKANAEKMDGASVNWMKDQAAKRNCAVTGSLIIEENGKYYNRLIWAEKDQLKFYDKRHLFSYAAEEKTYSAGSDRLQIELKGWKIFPLICYDLRFPVWSRRHKNHNYDLLIYVANWPERRIHAWRQLLIARAIENQCYVAGLNRYGNDGNGIFHSGDSAVIDFKGEKMKDENIPGEFISTYKLSYDELNKFRDHFAFFSDADDFSLS